MGTNVALIIAALNSTEHGAHAFAANVADWITAWVKDPRTLFPVAQAPLPPAGRVLGFTGTDSALRNSVIKLRWPWSSEVENGSCKVPNLSASHSLNCCTSSDQSVAELRTEDISATLWNTAWFAQDRYQRRQHAQLWPQGASSKRGSGHYACITQSAHATSCFADHAPELHLERAQAAPCVNVSSSCGTQIF